ncbi:hypothetical protein [Endozoicomonas sp. ALD040]|uniref:hypothetical protein n=1 Tax=Endozoicomonas sp. ALD040 TaxID=3403079 RepID=UPI003BAF98EA
MKLSDLSDDIKASLYTRLSSPLAGALMLSWVIWNIDAVLVIAFENKSMSERIAFVNDQYLTSFLFDWFAPVALGIAWILIYPVLSRIIFKYWETQRVEKEKTRIKLLGELPITPDEHMRLLKEVSDSKQKYVEVHEVNKKQSAEIENLIAKNNGLESASLALKNIESSLNDRISSVTEQMENAKSELDRVRRTLTSKNNDLKTRCEDLESDKKILLNELSKIKDDQKKNQGLGVLGTSLFNNRNSNLPNLLKNNENLEKLSNPTKLPEILRSNKGLESAYKITNAMPDYSRIGNFGKVDFGQSKTKRGMTALLGTTSSELKQRLGIKNTNEKE